MMMDHRLNVMTQAPYPHNMAALPNGIYIMQAYMDMKPGSGQVFIIVRNMMTRPIHLPQGKTVACIMASNAVLDAEPSPDLLKKLESDMPTKPCLSVEERHKLLITALEKDGGLERLKSWPPKLAAQATRLLLEYQDIFSLEPHEIGCMDITEHDIELLDHEPFKERFCCIAPLLVEEVQQHIQEMLDGGAIHPSQSPWCNAVVLVRKKDGSLHFCINFRRLNTKTKKDSYPLPWMQETMESMVGALHFSCMDLKRGFWQVKMSEKAHQYTTFTVGSMGVYEFLRMPHELCNVPAMFHRLMQNCLGELNLTYTLIYLDNIIMYSSTEEEHLTRLRAVFERFRESGLKLKISKCNFFRTEINYLGHTVSAKGMELGVDGIKTIAEMAPPKTYTGIHQF